MSGAVWVFVASGVLLPLVLAEFGGWCPWLTERVVRWSARQLGDSQVCARYEEEWAANLAAVPGQLSRLVAAIGYLLSIPRMRWSLRGMARNPRGLPVTAYSELVAAMKVPVRLDLLEHALTHRWYTLENGVCRPVSGWSSSAIRCLAWS